MNSENSSPQSDLISSVVINVVDASPVLRDDMINLAENEDIFDFVYINVAMPVRGTHSIALDIIESYVYNKICKEDSLYE